MIEPRTLKGFRDFLPADMLPREALIDTARRVYRAYGFAPIDTPVLEYFEILNGKGGEESDRLMYHFQDHGGREVGMRFDLTVPLARFVAQHHATLGMPFKRYHIAKVWRGENTHRGRYREFMQCDFDTIGTTSVAADIEMLLVIHRLLEEIGIRRFTMKVNHREVLQGYLEKLGVLEHSAAILRSLDKLGKLDRQGVAAELTDGHRITPAQADQILHFAALPGEPVEILEQVEKLVHGSERGTRGRERLAAIVNGALAAGISVDRLRLDLSIARGLDYYTGVIVETTLDELPEIGSICSGGRYDNLAGVYTKQELPGIGASLGLDRLLAAMDELQLLERTSTPAPVLLPFFDVNHLTDYLRLAEQLRSAGIGVEFYPDPKKLGQQLKYADQRGFRIAVIAGSREFERHVCQVKDLTRGESSDVSLQDQGAELVGLIRTMLTS